MKIILASKSPYRKHALDVLGVDHEVVPSNFDESSIRDNNPEMLAKKLSENKALEIGRLYGDAIIISSDLLVVNNDIILEKPHNADRAIEMLRMLSGKTFDIIVGLAVYDTKNDNMLSTVEKCSVTFRDLNDFEINDYITRYPNAIECAGAFESDGLLRFAEHIAGNYNFRAAIPVNKLIEFLRTLKVSI